MLSSWANITLIELEEPMVSPISDSPNRLITPVSDSIEHKNPSQEEVGSPKINVSLSEKAQELKVLESDSPLTEVLKKEFDEVFEFGGGKKDSFLKKLDHIFMNNRL